MQLRHETCGQQPVRHCGPFVQEPAGNSLRSANDHVSKLGSGLSIFTQVERLRLR